ncbi:MAG: hypothetical protein AAF997_13365 [Myxococcota bacterium]
MPLRGDRLRVGLRLGLAAVVLVLLVPAAGCKTFSDRTAKTRSALDANNLDAALKSSNSALGVRGAGDTPAPLEKNDALLLLDRAMVLQALHEYAKSSHDFEVADKAIEILDFSRSTANEIAKYLFTDSAGPYKARPYEKLMLNSENMLNYLAAHNLEDAKVEARRFSIMRSYLLEDEKEDPKQIAAAGAFGSYLAGYAFEKAGDAEEALRYYDEVLQFEGVASLAAPVRALMKRSGYRTPRLEAIAKKARAPSEADAQSADVLVVINYGRIPAMVAKRIPVGAALTIGALFLSPANSRAARRMAGQGLVTWVNFPELGPSRPNYPTPGVSLSTGRQQVENIANIDAVARHAWDQSKGRVVAAAIVRMVTRGAIGAGVGVAAGQASGKGSVGMVTALVTQAALAAGDKPDTRSWATLPARIAVARFKLPPGSHQIDVNVGGRIYTSQITVAEGQWAVIDITDLSNR